jgi:hypothetical protein
VDNHSIAVLLQLELGRELQKKNGRYRSPELHNMFPTCQRIFVHDVVYFLFLTYVQ